MEQSVASTVVQNLSLGGMAAGVKQAIFKNTLRITTQRPYKTTTEKYTSAATAAAQWIPINGISRSMRKNTARIRKGSSQDDMVNGDTLLQKHPEL